MVFVSKLYHNVDNCMHSLKAQICGTIGKKGITMPHGPGRGLGPTLILTLSKFVPIVVTIELRHNLHLTYVCKSAKNQRQANVSRKDDKHPVCYETTTYMPIENPNIIFTCSWQYKLAVVCIHKQIPIINN